MSIHVDWSNPYAQREGTWLKGGLHIHTSPASSCAKIELKSALDLYAQKGFDFIGIGDHNTLTDPQDDRFIIIYGTEWNSAKGEDTCIYSKDTKIIKEALGNTDQDELLASLAKKDAIVFLNHPNATIETMYTREQLLQKQNFDGLEIFNGIIERKTGSAFATDLWDFFLGNNRRVLGFACDDSHIEDDIGHGWIVAKVKDRTPAGIMQALKTGNFYCSTGVVINDIRRNGDVIEIESENAEEIQASSWGGRLRARVLDNHMSFDTSGLDLHYVRFTLFGYGSSMAWTQPFCFKDA